MGTVQLWTSRRERVFKFSRIVQSLRMLLLSPVTPFPDKKSFDRGGVNTLSSCCHQKKVCPSYFFLRHLQHLKIALRLRPMAVSHDYSVWAKVIIWLHAQHATALYQRPVREELPDLKQSCGKRHGKSQKNKLKNWLSSRNSCELHQCPQY